MRKKAYGTLKVRAISGTYVVFLAFDMKEADANGLMGFAIQRIRLSDGETRLWGDSTSIAFAPDHEGGGQAVSLRFPRLEPAGKTRPT
jgi:hypothetical protein